jgi:hypothetical protein
LKSTQARKNPFARAGFATYVLSEPLWIEITPDPTEPPSMDKITSCVGALLDHWQRATLVDYGNMVLAVVLLGWFVTRIQSR